MRKLAATVLFSLFTLFAFGAHAADKLRVERLDLGDYPTIKMFVTYVDSDGRVITGRQKEEFHLVLDSADQGAATGLVTFDTAAPPVNVNVVVVAQVSSAMNEVFEDLKRGIKNLADSFDPKTKSKMGLLGYASDTKRLVEMSAPTEAEAATNTMAIDSEGVEVHMLDALRTGIDLLNASPKGERKLIVLFSDGIDVNMDPRAFQALGKKAQDAGIVVDTIGYAPFEPGRLRNLQQVSRQSFGTDRQCKNAGDIGAQFAAVSDEIKKQYIVTFESVLKGGDGKNHTMQTMVDASGRQAYSNEITDKLPLPKHPIPGTKSLWWLWVLIAIGGLGLIGLIAWLVMREKPQQEEEPVAAAPAPAPVSAPMPQTSGPMKTMALDVSGGGKMPAVGWIVATSGKHVDQTFKFKPNRTIIGTAADCDIVIDDQFMSSRHCEVRIENGNYKLVDLGSTNGIVVNDKKVREHELVDNDQFRLGRTEFKFKSIS
jgi:FHA domain/von Willebrand factor type A domain